MNAPDFNCGDWFTLMQHQYDAQLISNGIDSVQVDTVTLNKPAVNPFKVLIAGYPKLSQPIKQMIDDAYGQNIEDITSLVGNRDELPVMQVGAVIDVTVNSSVVRYEVEMIAVDNVSRHVHMISRKAIRNG